MTVPLFPFAGKFSVCFIVIRFVQMCNNCKTVLTYPYADNRIKTSNIKGFRAHPNPKIAEDESPPAIPEKPDYEKQRNLSLVSYVIYIGMA